MVKLTLLVFSPPTAAIQVPDVLLRGGLPTPREGKQFGTRRLFGPGKALLSERGSGENVDSLESHSENEGLCNGGNFPLTLGRQTVFP